MKEQVIQARAEWTADPLNKDKRKAYIAAKQASDAAIKTERLEKFKEKIKAINKAHAILNKHLPEIYEKYHAAVKPINQDGTVNKKFESTLPVVEGLSYYIMRGHFTTQISIGFTATVTDTIYNFTSEPRQYKKMNFATELRKAKKYHTEYLRASNKLSELKRDTEGDFRAFVNSGGTYDIRY